MLALRSAPPVFSVAEAERIAHDVYGLDLVLQPLPGERDCNFRGETITGRAYVLKILGGADSQATDCQANVLRHLADQDPALPVPRVYATRHGTVLGSVERDTGYATCLLDYLPGGLLTAVDAPLLDQIGTTLARLDRALQGFFHPALARRIAWDVRRLPELVEFASCIESADLRRNVESVIAVLKNRLPALRGLRSQAIHGDCHPGNLLIDAAAGAVCGVLDFGDMIHAPLILEPAVAMSELLTAALVPPDALSDFLEGYARGQALDAADIEVLYDLVTARHAATLLVHAWRRRHDPVGARVLDGSAANAGPSLDALLRLGRDGLTRRWHDVAGTGVSRASIDLGRRHRLLGAGAELFYEQPLHIERGAGVWLYDPEGRAYLDAYNNVPHVGHAHPSVVRAIERQSAILATHTRYLHGRILDYAEQLTARCPPHLDACIFVNSGSEANDVAWRIAQFATGRAGGMIMAHAYHGITDAVAALTPGAGQPSAGHVVTVGTPPEGQRADDGLSSAQLAAAGADVDRAVHALTMRGLGPAAFFLDSALTSSGIYDPPVAWAHAVAARIRSAGGLIVADEVQYGLGRSGSHCWGFERRGLSPDMVTLGKPVGNGYPMGVVIANRSLIEAFQAKFGFFSTFGGNPVAAAGGLAVLRVLDREKLIDNARTTGGYLRRRLESLAAERTCLGAVRGTGLLLGVEVRAPAARDAQDDPGGAAAGDCRAGSRTAKALTQEIVNVLASRHRVLIGSEGPRGDILKIRPPMPFRPEHADLLVDAIAAATAVIDARTG